MIWLSYMIVISRRKFQRPENNRSFSNIDPSFLLNNRKSNRDLKRKKSIYESLYNMIKWQLGCLKQEGFFKAPFYSNILPLEKHISLESQNEVMQQWCISYSRKNDTPTTVFFFTCNKMVAREIGRRHHLIKRKEPLKLK